MKKGLFCVFVCMLMFTSMVFPLTAAPSQQKIFDKNIENQKQLQFWNIRHGFIMGTFKSVTWEGDRCILISNGQKGPYDIPNVFLTPFLCNQLNPDQLIQLVNPKFCLFVNNSVIGFSKIFLPKSKVIMHIISQNNQENSVTWIVDSIEGDTIWGCNMHARMYTQNGQKYYGEWSSGPYMPEYLSIGTLFQVTLNDDGVFRMILMDQVTGRVLFSSPLIKF